ncbi:ABC transporter transmembrane region 2-domain-containing protein [Pelagophyceae sp. CCMP2097]|nr:ABC transporter transmembrane region 2-domain-containing protein [Pelagophyceae sp. CCMP2097]
MRVAVLAALLHAASGFVVPSAPSARVASARRPSRRLAAAGSDDADLAGEVRAASKDSKDIGEQLRLFARLGAPYFSTPEARLGLLKVVGLTLVQSGVSVAFSYLGRDFYTALSQRDAAGFEDILVRFSAALLAGVPVTVLYRNQRELLSLQWRAWMTARVLALYTDDRAFYDLECVDRDGSIDNPDQRITEDVNAFTAVSLSFGITAITSIIDLCSFSTILYSIYAPLFGAIVAYALLGTALTAYAGRDLAAQSFNALAREADLRYSLVRLRENAEAIAFYKGADREADEVGRRLGGVVEAQSGVISTQRDVEFVTVAYRYLIQILPVAVIAPLYFNKEIELGVVTQASSAFNHILSDFSVFVNQFESIAAFGAGLDRLGSFVDRLGGPFNNASHFQHIEAKRNGTKVVVRTNSLTVATPDGSRTLVRDLDLALDAGERLLLVGASGTGKSSLLRSLAGLWPAAEGAVEISPDATVFFVPQKPYAPLGTLRDQLTYPVLRQASSASAADDGALLELLAAVGLGKLAARSALLACGEDDACTADEARTGLDAVRDWGTTLSLGEQQRVSFVRLLYSKPSVAILDEATSAMDIDTERRMYKLLQDRLSALTLISVGHRPSLLEHHSLKLRLDGSKTGKPEAVSEQDRRLAAEAAAL